MRTLLKEKPDFKLAIEDFDREYDLMIDIMSRSDED
jgi:hypothetical protein